MVPIPVRKMPNGLEVEGKRDVRVSADVDRALAEKVDELAKARATTRAAVLRAAIKRGLSLG